MAKVKKKLTPAQKQAKKKAKGERQKKYMWVFMNEKQVRVKRPETIDGIDPYEFIRNNVDPIWSHQNEMWELMNQEEDQLYVGEELGSYIYNFCGKWRDGEGNTIFIEPFDERKVYVTYVRSGEGRPLLRPWINNMPASKMIGRYHPECGPSLDVELSNNGDGFLLSLDFHFEDGNYNAIAPSIIRNEEDEYLEKYSKLFGALSSYHRQSDNGDNNAN